MFFFDNEGFRTACSKRQGITYDSDIVANMEHSWSKSREATMSLWNFVTRIEPHLTEGTIVLNKIRRDVLLMAEPLRVLLENLSTNIETTNVKKKELENLKINKRDLESRLYVDTIKLVPFRLNKPTTVCTNPSCTQQVSMGNAISQTVYSTKCHVDCSLNAVPRDQVNTNGLRYCASFTDSKTSLAEDGSHTCYVCHAKNGQSCSWNVHMHVVVDYRQEIEKVVLIGTKMQIDGITSSEGRVQTALKNLANLLSEQEEEYAIVTKASAQFASFIVHNSIAAVNYHAIELLKKQIAKAITAEGASSRRVQSLEKTKRTIEEEVGILQKAYQDSIESGTVCDALKPSTVCAKIQELCELKHSGCMLRKAIEDTKTDAREDIHHETVIPTKTTRKKEKKFGFFQRLW